LNNLEETTARRFTVK